MRQGAAILTTAAQPFVQGFSAKDDEASAHTMEQADAWSEARKILVMLAHPDDPEFFCGGTLARWARAGHSLEWTTTRDINPDNLCAVRHAEQAEAAAVIGARAVHWLDLPDGYLVPDIELRREIVRVIRRLKPDILMTCDPQTLFSTVGINHPDHRAAGQVVLDAAYPAAGNAAYFPELLSEGLEPHTPAEIWCSLPSQANVTVDITDTWPVKMDALLRHKTQVGDPEKFRVRMLSRHTEDSTDEHPRFEERFRVIKYH
jgi:LmbE family N-acetylglucosaminyl deacetylase